MEQDVAAGAATDRERHEPDAGGDEAGVEPDHACQSGADRSAKEPGDRGHENGNEGVRLLEEAGFVVRVYRDVEEPAHPPEDEEADDGGGREEKPGTLVGTQEGHERDDFPSANTVLTSRAAVELSTGRLSGRVAKLSMADATLDTATNCVDNAPRLAPDVRGSSGSRGGDDSRNGWPSPIGARAAEPVAYEPTHHAVPLDGGGSGEEGGGAVRRRRD